MGHGPTTNPSFWPALLATAASLLPACGGDEPTPDTPAPEPRVASAPRAGPGSAFPIPDPSPRIVLLGDIEFLSEEAGNALQGLADKVFVRDFAGAGAWLTADFVGHDLFAASVTGRETLALGAERLVHSPAALRELDRAGFLDAMATRLGAWRRLENAVIKLSSAQFERASPISRGKAQVRIELLGVTASGGREALRATGDVELVRAGSSWLLRRLALSAAETRLITEGVFTDVTRSTGVAHEGLRYGQPGNDTVAWNGLASADVDLDGRFDVFVPSSERSFLYRNVGDGTFREEAEERGVSVPGAGTGPVFLDYDNDGDADLAVAHVGFENPDRTLGGATLHLWRNDGSGHFEDVSAAMGLDLPRVGYSFTVLDYDRDGWLDLFLCGYGRMEVERNNSWVEATNGAPDLLFRNVEGRRFEDVSAAAGLRATRWSYSAAAADFDRDGDQDLYVGTNFGSNLLYRNAGDGTFADVAGALGVTERGNTMGVVFGDLDNDGLLDLFLANPSSMVGGRILERLEHGTLSASPQLDDLMRMTAGNSLFRGTADGRLVRVEQAGGAGNAGWAWGTALCDVDLDGALDVFSVNGFVTGDLPQDT